MLRSPWRRSPLVRTLNSPKLTKEEIDYILDNNESTGYTYAFSRSYTGEGPAEYRIPVLTLGGKGQETYVQFITRYVLAILYFIPYLILSASRQILKVLLLISPLAPLVYLYDRVSDAVEIGLIILATIGRAIVIAAKYALDKVINTGYAANQARHDVLNAFWNIFGFRYRPPQPEVYVNDTEEEPIVEFPNEETIQQHLSQIPLEAQARSSSAEEVRDGNTITRRFVSTVTYAATHGMSTRERLREAGVIPPSRNGQHRTRQTKLQWISSFILPVVGFVWYIVSGGFLFQHLEPANEPRSGIMTRGRERAINEQHNLQKKRNWLWFWILVGILVFLLFLVAFRRSNEDEGFEEFSPDTATTVSYLDTASLKLNEGYETAKSKTTVVGHAIADGFRYIWGRIVALVFWFGVPLQVAREATLSAGDYVTERAGALSEGAGHASSEVVAYFAGVGAIPAYVKEVTVQTIGVVPKYTSQAWDTVSSSVHSVVDVAADKIHSVSAHSKPFAAFVENDIRNLGGYVSDVGGKSYGVVIDGFYWVVSSVIYLALGTWFLLLRLIGFLLLPFTGLWQLVTAPRPEVYLNANSIDFSALEVRIRALVEKILAEKQLLAAAAADDSASKVSELRTQIDHLKVQLSAQTGLETNLRRELASAISQLTIAQQEHYDEYQKKLDSSEARLQAQAEYAAKLRGLETAFNSIKGEFESLVDRAKATKDANSAASVEHDMQRLTELVNSIIQKENEAVKLETSQLLAAHKPSLSALSDDELNVVITKILEHRNFSKVVNTQHNHETVTTIADPALVQHLVNDALRTFLYDKTGEADYALESSGGQVISTRCTKDYTEKSRVESIFGFPLWFTQYSPRSVIQRRTQNLNPGECWAVEGATAYLVIRLARTIDITAISYEHIPAELSISGNINSAPREFKIWSLQSENDPDKVLVGTYTYNTASGEPLQRFAALQMDPRGTPIVEFELLSNYGADYTCLYRLRVHGDMRKE